MLYAVINRQTKVVSCVSENPIEITEGGIFAPFRALDIKPNTHEVVTIEGLPGPFMANMFVYDNGTVTTKDETIYAENVAPKVSEVFAERERRLAEGFDYDFVEARGVHNFGTTEGDMKGWDEVSKIASAAINVGQPNTVIYIKTNTGMTQVTAAEWQMVLLAAAQFRQPIYQGYFTLKAMDPIPYNYKDNTYWSGV